MLAPISIMLLLITAAYSDLPMDVQKKLLPAGAENLAVQLTNYQLSHQDEEKLTEKQFHERLFRDLGQKLKALFVDAGDSDDLAQLKFDVIRTTTNLKQNLEPDEKERSAIKKSLPAQFMRLSPAEKAKIQEWSPEVSQLLDDMAAISKESDNY